MISEQPLAYFPGIIDVCVDEGAEPAFLCVREGSLSVEETVTIDGIIYSPPPRPKLPFTLPRLSEVLRHADQDDTSLYEDVLIYLKRFSALDNMQWAVVAHFIFLSYLHDHHDIDYCPYLLFHADPERGKSRTGKSVSYIAFRGIHLVELREALIFRYSNDIHGTLFFDIMDLSKKAEQGGCNDLLLYRAEKGAKSARVLHAEKGPFHDTTYYDIYGPTIIASNEQIHKILNTRCLPIDMPFIPGDYENPRPEFGLLLKERLTAWRARNLAGALGSISQVDGVSGRLWDITKPMLQVNALVNPSGHDLLLNAIKSISEKRVESRQDSLQGRLVGIIQELTEEKGCEDYFKWTIKTFEICNKYHDARPDEKRFPVSWFAKKLISMSIRHRLVNGRSEMLFTHDEYETLLQQYGYSSRGTDTENASSTEPLPELGLPFQQVSAQVEGSRGKQGSWTFRNPEEKEAYFEILATLQKEGGRTREDMENLAKDEAERRTHEKN